MTTRALVDANVLYSRTLRDWLIMIQLESGGGLYELCWTEDILAEVIYQFRRDHPTADGGVITRLRDSIAGSLEGGRIDDFVIDGSFPGVDPHDQHVHAAAIAADATYLITADGGFTSPGIDLDDLPYEVHTPDSFLVLVDDSAPHRVRAVTQAQERYWARRPRSKSLAQALQDAGCPDFAQRVRRHLFETPNFEQIIRQIAVDDLVFDEKVRSGDVAPAEMKAREAHRADLIAALDEARGTAAVTYAQFRKAFDGGAGCQVLYELRNRMDPKDVLKEAANDDLRSVGCVSPRATRQDTGGDDG